MENKITKRSILVHELTHLMMGATSSDVNQQMPGGDQGLEQTSHKRNEASANSALVRYVYDHATSFNEAAKLIRNTCSPLVPYQCPASHTDKELNDLILPKFGKSALLEGEERKLTVLINPMWVRARTMKRSYRTCPVHGTELYEAPKSWVYVTDSATAGGLHARCLLRLIIKLYGKNVKEARKKELPA